MTKEESINIVLNLIDEYGKDIPLGYLSDVVNPIREAINTLGEDNVEALVNVYSTHKISIRSVKV